MKQVFWRRLFLTQGGIRRAQRLTWPCCHVQWNAWSSASTALLPPACQSWAATPRSGPEPLMSSGTCQAAIECARQGSNLEHFWPEPCACRHWQDLGYLIIYITGRPDMQKQRVVSWLSQHNFPHGMIFFSEGLVHDPLRQKTIFLRNLIQEVRWIQTSLCWPDRFCEPTHNLVIVFLLQCHIKIISAYGSMKDISVYNMLGLSPSQIYIVGRPSKKYQNQCQVVWSSSEFVFQLIYSVVTFTAILLLSLWNTFSSWAMDMQHTSPCFSSDTEPDLRSLLLFAWFWEKVPLVSQQSQTSCVSAPTWEGPCQCSSRTRRAHPTPSPSVPKANRSLTRITVAREEAEQELVVAAGRSRGAGPPCSGETPLPDRKEAEGLIGGKGVKRRFLMARVKVRSVS